MNLRPWLQGHTLRVWTWDATRECTVERRYIFGSWRIPGWLYYWLWND